MTRMGVIRENLTDILGVEHNTLQRIERQSRDERVRKFRNAFEMLQKIRAVLVSHTGELERHLSSVDSGFETRLKKTATSVAGSIAGICERLRTTEPVSKNLRDDYTLLNHAVIGYELLHTAALVFEETEIISMARQHMADLTPLIVELSEIIPFVLAAELAGEVNIEGDPSVAHQAAAQYREAWTRKVTMRV